MGLVASHQLRAALQLDALSSPIFERSRPLWNTYAGHQRSSGHHAYHEYQQTRHLHIYRFLTGQPERPKKPPGPDAGDCDTAHDNYVALKERLDQIQKPSTLRSWPEVALDAGKSVIWLTIATGKFLIAIPGWIKDFYLMPKDEWAAWKAGAWKTVKHEAHHYWVGTKLLGMDIKISSRLAIKAARGLELTRSVMGCLGLSTSHYSWVIMFYLECPAGESASS